MQEKLTRQQEEMHPGHCLRIMELRYSGHKLLRSNRPGMRIKKLKLWQLGAVRIEEFAVLATHSVLRLVN